MIFSDDDDICRLEYLKSNFNIKYLPGLFIFYAVSSTACQQTVHFAVCMSLALLVLGQKQKLQLADSSFLVLYCIMQLLHLFAQRNQSAYVN